MNWFILGLISPALWGICNFLDKYLLSKYVKSKNPGTLLIFSSLSAILLLPVIFIFETNIFKISLNYIILDIINGILFILGIMPYYYALSDDDTSTVIPFFQIIPVIGYILGFIFLKETINLKQTIGSLIIILSAVGLSFDISRSKIFFKTKMFILMMIACLIWALNTLLFKIVAINSNFLVSSFWQYVGFVLTGLFFLIFIKSYRSDFIKVFKKRALKIVIINLSNEIINLVALVLYNYATLLVPIVLVMVLANFQSVFVLIYGIILTLFFPKLIKENISKKILMQKIFFILLMIIGSLFL